MTPKDFYIEINKLEDYILNTSKLSHFTKGIENLYDKKIINKDTFALLQNIWEYRNKYFSKGNLVEKDIIPQEIDDIFIKLKEKINYG